MKNTKEDKFAKKILLESKTEWNNPDFNKILMDKIRTESRGREILHSARFYFLAFVSIDAILFVLLNLMHVSICHISTKLNTIFDRCHELSVNTGSLMIICFVILLAAILFISTISSTSYTLSKKKLFN